jgi:hypothetical protein
MTTITALEAALGRNLEDYVTACQVSVPSVRADFVRVGTAVAGFTGCASPLTTVKGAGPSLPAADLEEIESFFYSRGAERVTIEAAPWLGDGCGRRRGPPRRRPAAPHP